MADIEKVIKGLECCSKNVRTCEVCPYDKEMEISGCDWDLSRDALELLKKLKEDNVRLDRENQKLIEQMAQQPHWIPAEERLPKSMINKVIVYVQHEDLASRIGFGHFEKYHGVGTWWDLERDEPFIKHGFTVTHWMPIPKSPYGEELILS